MAANCTQETQHKNTEAIMDAEQLKERIISAFTERLKSRTPDDLVYLHNQLHREKVAFTGNPIGQFALVP